MSHTYTRVHMYIRLQTNTCIIISKFIMYICIHTMYAYSPMQLNSVIQCKGRPVLHSVHGRIFGGVKSSRLLLSMLLAQIRCLHWRFMLISPTHEYFSFTNLFHETHAKRRFHWRFIFTHYKQDNDHFSTLKMYSFVCVCVYIYTHTFISNIIYPRVNKPMHR